MIAGTIASATTGDNMAFAKHKKVKQSIGQSNSDVQNSRCDSNGGFGLGTGNGLILGLGVGVGGPGLLNLCANSNPQTNAQTGNNGNVN